MGPVDPAHITVEVVCSTGPRQLQRVQLALPQGATVAQAIELSGFAALWSEIDSGPWACGVWGRRCELEQLLRNHDRLELCRPLKVDPKEARRQRHAQHLARFGKRKPAPRGKPA
jgi:putative ubiquitin-RnfH superfamily antitoxin RatB of RatAB toxin-antitoxin module